MRFLPGVSLSCRQSWIDRIGRHSQNSATKQTPFDPAKLMFRNTWDQRLAQAANAVSSAKHQIKAIEKQTEALLARLVETTNDSVIQVYEGKIADLEHSRLRLLEQAANHTVPIGSFKEKLEPALHFLANPWKLWETGHIATQRAVLRLAFKERLAYHLNKGARTPQLSLPFKALEGRSAMRVCFGAVCGN